MVPLKKVTWMNVGKSTIFRSMKKDGGIFQHSFMLVFRGGNKNQGFSRQKNASSFASAPSHTFDQRVDYPVKPCFSLSVPNRFATTTCLTECGPRKKVISWCDVDVIFVVKKKSSRVFFHQGRWCIYSISRFETSDPCKSLWNRRYLFPLASRLKQHQLFSPFCWTAPGGTVDPWVQYGLERPPRQWAAASKALLIKRTWIRWVGLSFQIHKFGTFGDRNFNLCGIYSIFLEFLVH